MAMHPEPCALLALKVQPRARVDAVLLRFLARKLGVPRRALELVRASSARQTLLGSRGCHQG